MGSSTNLIKIQTLLPERKPFNKPTTKDVITFKWELITTLTKCPDPQSDQGYACIMESEKNNTRLGPSATVNTPRKQRDQSYPTR